MRRRGLSLAAALALSVAGSAQELSPTTTLWYDKPATEWVEALPVGNGRLGAMVYGGVAEERIGLNEDTNSRPWRDAGYLLDKRTGHQPYSDCSVAGSQVRLGARPRSDSKLKSRRRIEMRVIQLAVIPVLAGSLALGAALAFNCENMAPQQIASAPTSGAPLPCGAGSCNGSVTTTYTYECTAPSDGNECVSGTALIKEYLYWTCDDPETVQCTMHNNPKMGPGLKVQSCDP